MIRRRKLSDPSMNNIFNVLSIGLHYTSHLIDLILV